MEYAEIQQNEVEALKAIYAGDFVPLPTSTIWNQRPCPRFRIKLRPSSEYESKLMVELQVTMTATYPKTLPQIEVAQAANLSGRQLDVLRQVVEGTIRELKGTEMVFEVTSNVQHELDEWARGVAEAAPSLEADRLHRLAQEEQRQREQHDMQQQRREAEQRQEERKFDTLILEELRKARDPAGAAAGDDAQALLVAPDGAPGVVTFQHAVRVTDAAGRALVFRQVLSTLRVPAPFFGASCIAKALLPPALASAAAGDVALRLIRIGLSAAFWRSPDGVRSLNELNAELELVRKFQHPGIVPLLAFSIERFQNAATEWEVTLLLPFENLTPLALILESTETVTLKTAQAWALQLLEALETLHKAGLRHKCICPDNVMVHTNAETGESALQLCHPQYLYALYKMNDAHAFDESTADCGAAMAAMKAPYTPPEGRGHRRPVPTSKWDLWQLGALLVHALAGRREFAKHTDLEAYVRARAWPPHLTNFLLALLQPDPAKRPSALELLTDEFFRADFEQREDSDPAIDSWISVVPSDSTLSAEMPLGPRARRLSGNDEPLSRYKHDFDEGIMLGRGGFGEVVKARNKLDGRVYAVKKITATAFTLSHILQEVVLLSRLNHQYVVRYYTVWLEDSADVPESNPRASFSLSGSVDGSKDPSADEARKAGVHGSVAGSVANSVATSVANSVATSIANSRAGSRADSVANSAATSGRNSANSFDALHLDPLELPSSLSFHSLDIPSASQDFMSDSGFVQFEFGSDDEPESVAASTQELVEDTQCAETARPRPARERKEVVARTQLPKKTLYIQMEYCQNHTLADLIRQGLYRHPEQYWRLLRQILVALAYIHSEGVIHRDLKPKNIFIDQANNIKIGDFGLARQMVKPLGRQTSADPAANSPLVTLASLATSPPPADGGMDEELTTDVGTSLYAAVEMTSANQRRGYNEKVDIFSLGIIFLEMVWEMDTEMERVQTIRRARMSQIDLPPKLVASKDMAVQVDIIRSALNHDPACRPSAAGLLKSGKIPVEDREMTVQDALQNIRDPRIVQQLATALFSQPLVSAQQVLYDRTASTTPGRRQARIQDLVSTRGRLAAQYVEQQLRLVFETHGAVDNTAFRSKIFPRSPVYRMPTVVELVDPQGIVLQLPHDLTLPHARRLAEVVPEYRKSCAFDTVYRTILASPGRHPAIHTEVDFDITSIEDGENKSLLFDEAEAIAVMYDAACSVLSAQHELIVVVGHHDILSAALSHCGLSPPQYYAALGLLASGALDRPGSSSIARSNISTASLDMLGQFGFREQLEKADTRLARLMNLTERVRRALLRVKLVAQTFATLVCATPGRRAPPVYFSPLIQTATADFYTNCIMFQLVDIKDTFTTTSQRQLAAGSVLAVGGRYDSLIKSARNQLLDARTPLAHAVGFGMSANKLAAVVERQQGQQQQPPSRCEVLVSSMSASMLREHGADVLKLLWRNGISADIVSTVLAVEDLVARAIKDGAQAIVLLKQFHASAPGSTRTAKPLKVKRISRLAQGVLSDADLGFGELVPFLQQEIGGLSKTRLSTPSSASLEAVEDENLEREPSEGAEKTIVMNDVSKIKGGRKNKWQLEVKAADAKRSFLDNMNQAPVISLDLKNDVIEAICTVPAGSPEDWKRRVVGLSPNQKAYIMNVQAKLATEAARHSVMLLHSSKTDDVFIYKG